jgi:glucokinase
LETIASATGISRLATEAVENHPDSKLYTIYKEKGRINSEDVFTCAGVEDAFAMDVVQRVTHHLGLAIGNLSNALNPSRIVIGGGVSKAGEQLVRPLKESFGKFALPRVYEGADFAIASLGNDAGVIGAAKLVLSED